MQQEEVPGIWPGVGSTEYCTCPGSRWVLRTAFQAKGPEQRDKQGVRCCCTERQCQMVDAMQATVKIVGFKSEQSSAVGRLCGRGVRWGFLVDSYWSYYTQFTCYIICGAFCKRAMPEFISCIYTHGLYSCFPRHGILCCHSSVATSGPSSVGRLRLHPLLLSHPFSSSLSSSYMSSRSAFFLRHLCISIQPDPLGAQHRVHTKRVLVHLELLSYL